METNPRGEVVEELIFSRNLKVENFGTEPTFKCFRGQEIQTRIDVTLSLNFEDEISNWRVSNWDTLSDHNEIAYELDFQIKPVTETVYIHKKLDAKAFNDQIVKQLPVIPNVITPTWLDEATENLCKTIRESFEEHCPKRKKTKRPIRPHYWTPEVVAARKGSRRAWKRYRKVRSQSTWDHYKATRNLYNNVLYKSKRKSLKKHYTSVESVKDMSKLVKATQHLDYHP